METVQKLVLISCFLGVATSVADALKPSEKFEKQLKLIFSVIFALAVLTPFVSGSADFSFDITDSIAEYSEYSAVSEIMDTRVIESAKKNVETALSERLKASGINFNEISASIDIDEEKCISINEVRISCDNKAKAEKIVHDTLGNNVNVKVTENE